MLSLEVDEDWIRVTHKGDLLRLKLVKRRKGHRLVIDAPHTFVVTRSDAKSKGPLGKRTAQTRAAGTA